MANAIILRFLRHVEVARSTTVINVRRLSGRIRFLSSRSKHISYCGRHHEMHSVNTGSDSEHTGACLIDEQDELSGMAKDLNMDKVELAEKILCHSIKESKGKLGSGVGGANMCAYPCANWSIAEGFDCKNPGVIPCLSCGLVSYCSLECKKENLGNHRSCCESASDTTGLRSKPVSTSSKKAILKSESDFLWGNVPAYSILGQDIKAVDIPQNLFLCFSASGDLRNVIETICQLPNKFAGQVTVYINDHNPMVVARNFLMLKLLQVYHYDAVDAIIALWYSAAMTHSQSIVTDGVVIDTLKNTVRCGKQGEFQVNFKPFSSSTLSVENGAQVWPLLARMSASKCSMQSIWSSRMEKLKSGLKFDCKTACLRPSHQVAWKEFQEQGLLLPCGACHAHHCAPNKFLLHPLDGWVISGDANPFSGWDIMNVLATGTMHGVAKSDLFASLFFHLRSKLQIFLHKLETCEVHLKLSCKDAAHLAGDLIRRDIRLHCVDTSNIADLNYGGLKPVLHDWGPLLNRASGFTPTLITYFMNWAYADTKFTSEQITLSKLTWADVDTVVALMGKRSLPESEGLKELLSLGNSHGNLSILDYFHDFTPSFEDYLKSVHAEEDAARVGLKRREKHLIVPHRFSIGVEDCNGIPGRTASYDQCYYDCMVGDLTFTERFVEWGIDFEGRRTSL